jgi:CDGSH-type Zn-finger protein
MTCGDGWFDRRPPVLRLRTGSARVCAAISLFPLGRPAYAARLSQFRRSQPMTDTPHIAQKAPFAMPVEAGKNYFWCSCGQSKNQPFCDGSHKGSDFTPVKFTAEETKTVYLCGCKNTKNAPFCDGAHKAL